MATIEERRKNEIEIKENIAKLVQTKLDDLIRTSELGPRFDFSISSKYLQIVLEGYKELSGYAFSEISDEALNTIKTNVAQFRNIFTIIVQFDPLQMGEPAARHAQYVQEINSHYNLFFKQVLRGAR